MKHPYFHKAVMTAFDRLVPNGEQVSYFIYLTVDPQDIDVNIHPVKTEIKFDNERDIWQILMAAVRDAIGKFSDITTLDFDTEGKPDIPVFNPSADPIEAPRIDFNPQYNPFHTPAHTNSTPANGKPHTADYTPQRKTAKGWEELFGTPEDDNTSYINKEKGNDTLFSSRLSWQDYDSGKPPADITDTDMQAVNAGRATEHYQLRGSYIVTQVQSGLMITDQNRASQRILFEQYMNILETRNAHTQKVLFPEMVQFPPSCVPTIAVILDELRTLGFEITDLGGGSYAIAGIPAGLGGLDTVRLVSDLVTEAMDTDVTATEDTQHTGRRTGTESGHTLRRVPLQRRHGEPAETTLRV